MISDFNFILNWWIVLFFIGIVFLPLTILIFNNFFDKGYIFSKILGIVFLSYTIWLLASLKILPFDTYSIFSLIGSFIILSLYIAKKINFLDTIKTRWKIFLFEEILFFAGLIIWSFIRVHEPSIHGLEKYMDFGFINSILRSEYFPPKDLWLTPESINYYYFGHLIVAMLTKLSFLDSAITYNLMVATLFAYAFTGSFSIGANLMNFNRSPIRSGMTKVIFCGLLTAFLLTLAGNSHTIYAFFQNYNTDSPIPFWQLKPALNFSGYWYPNATRFIPNTIHEFPLYSFIVSDLHGHVLNIPIVLLVIATVISIYFKEKIHFGYYLFLGLLIGIMLMTNILDGPIYLLLFSLIVLFKYKLNGLKLICLVAALSIIFSLPFWLNFKPFGQGAGVLCAPTFLTSIGKIGPLLFEPDHCAHSPLWMLAVIYGFFYFIFFGFLAKIRNQISLIDNLILIFILFATIAIFIPEIFYVKDIYPAHFRANTVFKFGFQAFIVLSLASSYMIFRIYQKIRWHLPFLLFTFYFLLLFSLISIYPYFAIRTYYGELKAYHGLEGLNYLNNLYPSDYKALLWIKNNIRGQPVMLEAVGESYTDYARISSNTGLPTILGWPVHEWLWRGSPEEGNKRAEDVKILYETAGLEETLGLINKYNISYVFIGELEKQKYTNLNEEKFFTLGKIVFQEDQATIYKID